MNAKAEERNYEEAYIFRNEVDVLRSAFLGFILEVADKSIFLCRAALSRMAEKLPIGCTCLLFHK
jgi:hypothetical protein